MDVRIKAIHFDASQKLVDFINRKVERMARRNPEIAEVDVTLKLVKPETAMNKEVMARVAVSQQGEKVATKVAATFEEGVDVVLEAIERQLEKRKLQQ